MRMYSIMLRKEYHGSAEGEIEKESKDTKIIPKKSMEDLVETSRRKAPQGIIKRRKRKTKAKAKPKYKEFRLENRKRLDPLNEEENEGSSRGTLKNSTIFPNMLDHSLTDMPSGARMIDTTDRHLSKDRPSLDAFGRELNREEDKRDSEVIERLAKLSKVDRSSNSRRQDILDRREMKKDHRKGYLSPDYEYSEQKILGTVIEQQKNYLNFTS